MNFAQWLLNEHNLKTKDVFWFDLVTVYLDQYKRWKGR